MSPILKAILKRTVKSSFIHEDRRQSLEFKSCRGDTQTQNVFFVFQQADLMIHFFSSANPLTEVKFLL